MSLVIWNLACSIHIDLTSWICFCCPNFAFVMGAGMGWKPLPRAFMGTRTESFSPRGDWDLTPDKKFLVDIILRVSLNPAWSASFFIRNSVFLSQIPSYSFQRMGPIWEQVWPLVRYEVHRQRMGACASIRLAKGACEVGQRMGARAATRST